MALYEDTVIGYVEDGKRVVRCMVSGALIGRFEDEQAAHDAADKHRCRDDPKCTITDDVRRLDQPEDPDADERQHSL